MHFPTRAFLRLLVLLAFTVATATAALSADAPAGGGNAPVPAFRFETLPEQINQQEPVYLLKGGSVTLPIVVEDADGRHQTPTTEQKGLIRWKAVWKNSTATLKFKTANDYQELTRLPSNESAVLDAPSGTIELQGLTEGEVGLQLISPGDGPVGILHTVRIKVVPAMVTLGVREDNNAVSGSVTIDMEESTRRVWSARDVTNDQAGVVTWESSDINVVTLSANSSGDLASPDGKRAHTLATRPLTIVAVGEGKATITVSGSGGGSPLSIEVIVFEPVQDIRLDRDRVEIREGDTVTIPAVVEIAGSKKTSARKVVWTAQDTAYVEVDDKTGEIRGLRAGTATVTVRAGKKSRNITVVVKSRASRVLVEGPNTLVPGGTVRLKVRILDQKGTILTEKDRPLELAFNPSVIVARQELDDPEGRLYIVTARTAGDALLEFKIDGKVVGNFQIQVVSVAAFKPMRVALDIMDETTAADLFGKRTSEEFYVLRVRLFNNLNADQDPRLAGQSILAYSESIEAGVQMERIYDRESNSAIPEAERVKRWTTVVDENVTGSFTRAKANEENPFVESTGNVDQAASVYRIFPSVLELDAGTTGKLSLMRNGAPVSAAFARWRSENGQVAVVNDAGTITVPAGTAAGFVRIHATVGKQDVEAVVVVRGQAESSSGIRIAPTPTENLDVGQVVVLEIRPGGQPIDASQFEWSSDRTGIAEIVNNTNVIRARAPGVAIVTATRRQSSPGSTTPGVFHILVVVNASDVPLPPSTFIGPNGQLQYLRHRFRYRPYAFEMILNTVENRDQRTPRTQVFRYLRAVGSVLSFFSAVKEGNQTTAQFADKYGNLFLPGIERLWPSLKDTQRQNLVSMAMRPIEEIPFGADIARVLFFPKRPFRGVLAGNLVRISEVDTSYFNVTVAVVDKRNSQTQNAAAP